MLPLQYFDKVSKLRVSRINKTVYLRGQLLLFFISKRFVPFSKASLPSTVLYEDVMDHGDKGNTHKRVKFFEVFWCFLLVCSVPQLKECESIGSHQMRKGTDASEAQVGQGKESSFSNAI